MRARPLAVHAALVGGGWFVLAFVALVGIVPNGWFRDVPDAVKGAGLTLVVVAAVPLAWPVYLALGWYESGLATRISRGDERALRPARRVLHAQAALFTIAATAAAAFAIGVRDANGAGHAALAWLPLLLVAAGHLWTAHRISAPPRDAGRRS